MKIAIATLGRFHVLDLARELSAQGHEVAFYSLLTQARALQFGLPAKSYRGHLAWAWPLVAAQRLGGARWRSRIDLAMLTVVDRLIARHLEPCDAFIGMSGLCIDSAHAARNLYRAKVFIERGSRHIQSQRAILEDLSGRFASAETVPAYAIQMHEASANIADFITVPSQQVVQSFTDRGFPEERLFLNPYGVDLSMFVPTLAPRSDRPVVVFAGTWSYRKGCDVLTEAVRMLGGRVRLLHVGAAGDAPFPQWEWFERLGPVPQAQLSDVYARATLSVLASREEGLALVQAQALACGLPLVCTDRTGGADFKGLLGLEDGVFVVAHDDAAALAEAIERALRWATARFTPGTIRDLLGASRAKLSWREYGLRYSRKLEAECREGSFR